MFNFGKTNKPCNTHLCKTLIGSLCLSLLSQSLLGQSSLSQPAASLSQTGAAAASDAGPGTITPDHTPAATEPATTAPASEGFAGNREPTAAADTGTEQTATEGLTQALVSGDLFQARNSINQRLNNYLDEIRRIETEYGAYSNQLSEHLGGLGRAYQDLGRHSDAIEVFKRAAHVTRINDGLYSLNQVPIIEQMTNSLIERGDWAEASSSKRYMLWLYENNYDDSDPRMLPVMDSLGSWFLSYHAMHFNWQSIHLVAVADDMFKDSLRIISNNYGESDLRNAEPLKGLIHTNWYFRNLYHMHSNSAYEVEFSDSRDVPPAVDPQIRRLDLSYQRSERTGEAAIHSLIELYADNPDAPPGAEAQAIVELGDWNLLFGDPMGALDSYKQAQQKLAQDERVEARQQIDKLFGRPVALPDLPLLDSVAGVQPEEVPVTGYVVAQFDVTERGNVRNIRILESMPENDIPKRKRVKTSLSNTKFRPRFVDGEPVPTEQIIHRYVFND